MFRAGLVALLLASCEPVATLTPPAHAGGCGKRSALDAEEEKVAASGELASRFNPAMAFPTRDIWPVEVRYAWHDGADLVARVRRRWSTQERAVVPAAELGRRAWGQLPAQDADGRVITYGIDAPGDDRMEGDVSRWVARWRAINGADVPDEDLVKTAYPPTQYAHLFWLDRDAGLLAIQYYFYYPYNQWLNHHEGDWEHINVVLEGPSRLTPGAEFRVRYHEFFFHDWSMVPDRVMTSTGSGGRGEHVVVFVGGRGRLLAWSGDFSGGSYPMPAVYRHAGGGPHPMRPSEDTRNPRRFIPASTFRIVVLPEPWRLDDAAHPELSWLKLEFRVGQARVFENPPFVALRGGASPPRQPARSLTWNACRSKEPWAHEEPEPASDALPEAWGSLMRVASRSRLAVDGSRQVRGPGS